MADLITIGSLYLDGHPYPIGERYRNFQPISIGNSVSGQEISWVVANGLLIADRSLLTCISWEDLFENHLIFGQKITVDGYSFQLRLLKVGENDNDPNEWDAALDAVGDDSHDLWHWGKGYFWGQEGSLEGEFPLCPCRGYNSARYRENIGAFRQYALAGYRPVLEPVCSNPNELTPGREMFIWIVQKLIRGCAEEVTDYDFVLPAGPEINADALDVGPFGAWISDSRLIIDKAKIDCFQVKKD